MAENLHKKIQLSDSMFADRNTALHKMQGRRNRLTTESNPLKDSFTPHYSILYCWKPMEPCGSGKEELKIITRLKQERIQPGFKTHTAQSYITLPTIFKVQGWSCWLIPNQQRKKRKTFEKTAAGKYGLFSKKRHCPILSAQESSVWWACLLISLLSYLLKLVLFLPNSLCPSGPYDIALQEELMHMAASGK